MCESSGFPQINHHVIILGFSLFYFIVLFCFVFVSDMFALPNKKAMEVVMHFLFTRLHPQLAYEEFRYCTVDSKMCELIFLSIET